MMTGKYGDFTDEQIKKLGKQLHSKVHWLLVYKESGKCNFYDNYFVDTMKYFNSLYTVLGDNPAVMEVLVTLQTAYDEVKSENFDFPTFRKYILEAHNIIANKIVGDGK